MTGDGRRRLAAFLRLIASAALLVTVVTFFYRPLAVVLGPALYRSGLTSAFQGSSAPGFVLQVVSIPPGAVVRIDGVARGTTPAMLNVACRNGDDVALTVSKAGYPEFRQSIPCRQGVPARARIDLTE
ncbi:MAG: PEGA domain-containing protein [Thermoanaerobaculia bacterium]